MTDTVIRDIRRLSIIKKSLLLVELGLFNSELMNDVVYKFRNYEDASMSYSGINRHEGELVAGFDDKQPDFIRAN